MSSVTRGRIPDAFIDHLLAKTDIVPLIQESLPLKKQGAEFSACCPFHQEKTPSFTVSPAKQFYHCFGCGAHGNALHFLMAHHSLHFVEAVEKLATRLGITLPRDPEAQAKYELRTQLTKVLNEVALFYAGQFKQSAQALPAIHYLKKRGVTGESAKAFQLGLALSGWHTLLTHFKEKTDYLPLLEQAGLIIKHPQRHYYDRFRERILFPIRDRKGDVIGFGGRVLDNSQPKYLNSPETPLFQKGHCLYGLYEALQTKSHWRSAIIVEGYFDVVMLTQCGIQGVVATLGTATTVHHLTQLFQYVSEIIFCFDGDKAGKAAAWKALQISLPLLEGVRQIRFAFVPQGYDPDSYIRQVGKEGFEQLLQQSAPLSDYLFAYLCESFPPHSLDGRAQLANAARALLVQLPKGIFREMMFEQLAQLVASPTAVVKGENSFQGRARSRNYKEYRANKPPFVQRVPLPALISPPIVISALLLREPSFAFLVEEKRALWETAQVSGMPLLQRLLALLKEASLTSADLRLSLEKEGTSLKILATCEEKIALIPTDGIEAELKGAVQRLVLLNQSQCIEKLLKKAKEGELSEAEKLQLKEILQNRESIS